MKKQMRAATLPEVWTVARALCLTKLEDVVWAARRHAKQLPGVDPEEFAESVEIAIGAIAHPPDSRPWRSAVVRASVAPDWIELEGHAAATMVARLCWALQDVRLSHTPFPLSGGQVAEYMDWIGSPDATRKRGCRVLLLLQRRGVISKARSYAGSMRRKKADEYYFVMQPPITNSSWRTHDR